MRFSFKANSYQGQFQGQLSLSKMLLAATILAFSLSPQTYASKGGETSDNARVVTITVDQLDIIKDRKIASFSLAAVSGGRMAPIPFQFDERTESGYVYMKDLSKKRKAANPIVGQEAFFDAKDELLFMYRDAGPRRKNGMSSDGKMIAEIQVRGYDGSRNYVYLIEGARLESEGYYVRYSSELGRVETDYYALKVDPKNAFLWEEFYYDSFDGAHSRRPIDTIKLRMKSNAFGAVPITVNNKHIVAKAIAEKSGPIRSTTEYKVTLTYMKTPLLNLNLQIVHHEQEIRYDAITSIPKVRRRLIAKPWMKISIDGYDLQGAEIRSSNGPDEAAIVDGAISSIEEELINSPLNAGDNNWYFMDTHYGMMMFVDFNIESSEPVPLGMMYVDEASDKRIKPEYYAGQLPNVGFELKDIPLKGEMRITTNIHMYNEELDIDVKEFANIVLTDPIVKIRDL